VKSMRKPLKVATHST